MFQLKNMALNNYNYYFYNQQEMGFEMAKYYFGHRMPYST